jgi:hypothetical protein
VLRKRLTLTGSTLRPRPVAFKAAIAASLRDKVWPLLVARRVVKPVIQQVFPADAGLAGAHAAMEAGRHVGKLMLSNGPHNFRKARTHAQEARRRQLEDARLAFGQRRTAVGHPGRAVRSRATWPCACRCT